MNLVAAWLLALMTSLAPPARLANAPALPGWAETAQERTSRYEAIAADLHAVVYDPAVKPLFRGPKGRAQTAALLLALAFEESGFAKDVDVGPCYPQRDPKTGYVRCDGGASACMMQIRVGAGTTVEGWTREDLFADRRKCFAAGLRKARQSISACSRAGLPVEQWLNAYASGGCDRGQAASKKRWEHGRRLFERGGAPEDATNLFVPPTAPATLSFLER